MVKPGPISRGRFEKRARLGVEREEMEVRREVRRGIPEVGEVDVGGWVRGRGAEGSVGRGE